MKRFRSLAFATALALAPGYARAASPHLNRCDLYGQIFLLLRRRFHRRLRTTTSAFGSTG